ncbi:PilX N-terminal domain-containing pilus assembly protein [Thiocapsa bogorovii]|uniref:PilX N-terminal domain-containing pilus assembly protein n=1 Tax=Thiocapsa bogorovii TaxID=521689 RepID=UPI001E352A1B|nr:PilX N-terminal domain-containing pilus assembly protein [Thiocapsa bogorovii]UHD15791.1 hypothetical protein LT988_21445 [Thiocapsa bogorovii]
MRTPVRSPSSQRGALTLLLGLLLLMGSTILTLSSVRVGIMEQRIANNERRALEAQQAAQAGLDYALAMLGETEYSGGTAPDVAASADYTYAVTVTRRSAIDGCIHFTSRAEAESDAGIAAVATECFQRQQLLATMTGSGNGLPPLVVNGGIQNIKGTPDIYPRTCDETGEAEDWQSIAVASSADGIDLDMGHFNKNNKDGIPIPSGDQIATNAFEGSAWDYVFGISKDTFKALAAAGDPRFFWISDSSKKLKDDLGEPNQPVYVAFDQAVGCPKLGGTIYGIVYFESPTACRSQGWGGAEINGSVVFEGGLDQMTANGGLFNWSWVKAKSGTEGADLQQIRAARVPGSWRDWD